MRKMLSKKKAGFTLIELMIVVAILGILAAIAIPAFVGYIRRSKTAEATSNVNNLFKAAASYYVKEFTNQGVNQPQMHHCTVGPAVSGFIDFGGNPGEQKQTFDYYNVAEFKAIGFSLADPHYYKYEIDNQGGTVNNVASLNAIYTFRATGDLDGDSTFSTFELAAGSDANNDLFHGTGFYIVDETE